MNVRLIAKTVGAANTEYENQSIDSLIVGQARLSSSREVNELFDDGYKLLRYCLTNGHMSPFDLANLSFEITTSRAIGRQLIRHVSLHAQERSQRYVAAQSFEDIEVRAQSKNNRQSSSETINPVLKNYNKPVKALLDTYIEDTNTLYEAMTAAGVALESARMILPETTTSVLIFNGTIRSWITLLNVRLHKGAQKEVRDPANIIKEILIKECPMICEALFNFEDAYDIYPLNRLILEKYGVYEMVKASGYKNLSQLK